MQRAHSCFLARSSQEHSFRSFSLDLVFLPQPVFLLCSGAFGIIKRRVRNKPFLQAHTEMCCCVRHALLQQRDADLWEFSVAVYRNPLKIFLKHNNDRRPPARTWVSQRHRRRASRWCLARWMDLNLTYKTPSVLQRHERIPAPSDRQPRSSGAGPPCSVFRFTVEVSFILYPGEWMPPAQESSLKRPRPWALSKAGAATLTRVFHVSDSREQSTDSHGQQRKFPKLH